jgi:hypothetical protein
MTRNEYKVRKAKAGIASREIRKKNSSNRRRTRDTGRRHRHDKKEGEGRHSSCQLRQKAPYISHNNSRRLRGQAS